MTTNTQWKLSGLLCSLVLVTALAGCNAAQDNAAVEESRQNPATPGNAARQNSDQTEAIRTANRDRPIVLAEATAPSQAADVATLGATLAKSQVVLPYPAPGPGFRDHGFVVAPQDRENYDHFAENPVRLVSEAPVSTFSIDVDTAAYSNIRRLLNAGALPPHDAVRVEELINYFSYTYPIPESADTPFSLTTEMGPSPWHPERKLLHIGIQGYQPSAQALPPANLVFLVDVSGSMQSADKLGLLKSSLKLLVRQLDADDRIAIAVYAGAAGTVLEPTAGSDRTKILSAIDRLTAGGSTNGGAGIELAYSLAAQNLRSDSINRVILATDGDFNVGTTDQQALKDLIERKRQSGVALTVLGFGSGNYNDALMQELAQIGNGNAAYIDTLNEARKVLVDELAQTLNIIAQDVKIQLEFNPALVAEYRLIGYESRHLEREDFNNDRVDAGDIGAGHTVTALYELALTDSAGTLIDPLRYQAPTPKSRAESAELGFLKLRYKQPGSRTSALVTQALLSNAIENDLAATSANYRFSAAVAAFGQLLRGGDYLDGFSFEQARSLASEARGADPFGYRGEFLSMLRTAEVLAGPGVSPHRSDSGTPVAGLQ